MYPPRNWTTTKYNVLKMHYTDFVLITNTIKSTFIDNVNMKIKNYIILRCIVKFIADYSVKTLFFYIYHIITRNINLRKCLKKGSRFISHYNN